MLFALHEKTQSVVLRCDDPLLIRDLFPQSRTLDHPDYNAATRHTIETTRVLRNIGFDVPYPKYGWPGKYKPMEHQLEMVDFYLDNFRGFNLSEMGTGKTAATLWAADQLMVAGVVNKALILAPLSSLERTWQQDIFDVLMHRQAAIVHGTREQRTKALATDSDFYILNHDGVTITVIAKLIRKRKDINLVIVDEGSMFREARTEKYKALAALLRPDQRLWWITGTPAPNKPTDAWSQARLVNPVNVPQFFGAFRRNTMTQLTQHKWVPKLGAKDLVFKALQPAIRFEKKDCLDLPPVVTISKVAQLTKMQRDAFKDMKARMQADADGTAISAVNAADKIGKLRQILCGAIKDPETGDYIELDHGPRLEVLKEVIDGASAKVIVIVPFKGIIKTLAHELRDDYTVGVLNGDVGIRARNEIITSFKTTANPHVLLCHPKVMSHSLNLTEADTIAFYAPIYSNDEFQQVVERFNRLGQKRKMTVARIGAHPLEWEIYRLVDQRRIEQDTILDLYRRTIP